MLSSAVFLPRTTAYLALTAAGMTPLTGCAAILGSKTAEVAALSEPPGAAIYLDGGRVGVTPDTIKVESKRSHEMVMRLAGYEEGSCRLTSSVDGGWVLLDVLFGGLLGVIVDAATGEWNEIGAKSCAVTLAPLGGLTGPVIANSGSSGQPTSPEIVTPAPSVPQDAGLQPESQRPAQPVAPQTALAPLAGAPGAARFNAELISYPQFRQALSDVRRFQIVADFQELQGGVLKVLLGPGFRTTLSAEHNLGRLRDAYSRTTEGVANPLLELWEGGVRIGVYDRTGLLLNQ